MDEDQKLERQEYLAKVLHKYMLTEPKLSLDDIAVVLAEEIEDLTPFLKKYIKELKK
jgi:hypothetical protein